MTSRVLSPSLRLAALRHSSSLTSRRTFATSLARFEEAVVPVRKPAGAFRSGFTGFLLGSVLSGAGMYYYVLNEYRVSNELLTEDIFNMQASVQRIEAYVKVLEDQIAQKK